MPTYQYVCTECGHQLEAVQSFSDGPLTECPNCGGKLRKVFSAVGVVFKGSGFYRTDSRGGSSSSTVGADKPKSTSDSGSSSDSGGTSSGTKSSDTKSDSGKPAASSGGSGKSGGSGSGKVAASA